MHIAILIQDFAPETGAGPARISELAAAWQRQGHTVTVLTGFPNRRLPGQQDGVIPPPYRGRITMRETLHGITVIRAWLWASPRRGFAATVLNHATFAASALAIGLARLPRVDVLIASGPPYFAQFTGAMLAAWQRVPLVVEIRDLWPDYLAEMGLLRSALLRRAVFGSERWLLRRAREVVAVTDAFRERIEAKGVAADRIAVIPNGVDTGRYFPTDEPPPVDALRRSSPDECVVGYLGTFGRGQGLDAVIDAVRRVRESGRPIRLVAVGDGPERPALERVLSERPAPFVHLGTPIPRDLTRAFYNACDVVLVPHASLPILGDTLPSKIFEAMACARPIVAALGGEGARLVTRSDGGIVAAPGDPAAIADALDRMLALSPAERNAMGDRARRFALAEFDRETLAQRYLERLQRLVPAAIRTERR